jgi:hypothetical protein
MARKTKIKRGFYPISYADIKRMIGYCDSWGYGNKDTCKYVAENIIERLNLDYEELPIKDDLHSDLISITHDINNGANFKGKELLISFK